MEWTHSIGYRPDTLTKHASIYKNHVILDNINLKRFYHISNILDSSWLSPVSIVSMGENFASVKIDHSIFNRKTCMGLKRVIIHDFTNIIQDFFILYTFS